jgi:hypothetical protein
MLPSGKPWNIQMPRKSMTIGNIRYLAKYWGWGDVKRKEFLQIMLFPVFRYHVAFISFHCYLLHVGFLLCLFFGATWSSETSVGFQRTTWCYIPEDKTLENHYSPLLSHGQFELQPSRKVLFIFKFFGIYGHLNCNGLTSHKAFRNIRSCWLFKAQ